MTKEAKVFTYQVRPFVDEAAEAALSAFGRLYGTMERHLFQDLMDKKEINEVKRRSLQQFGVTARQFNGCLKLLQGKIQSLCQGRRLQITLLKDRIDFLMKKIPKIKNPFKRHQKKRHLHTLLHKQETLKQEDQEGIVSLCFGSKKLFSAQFHLEASGYTSFEEWKQEWEQARSSEFFCLGSKDETAGNQTCTLTFSNPKEGHLRLRLPNALESDHGKYLFLPISFSHYGRKEVEEALANHQAISYRFKRNEKGWQVFISVEKAPSPIITKAHTGSIGVDLNVDHIALVETDVHGNPIDRKTISLCTYGARSDQAKALIGDAVQKVILFAKEKQKPLVREELSFAKKKASLKEDTGARARMLSSFHYATFMEYLDRKGFREGIPVHTVNPAMTSIIGRFKFSKRYGLSTHHSAALVIARRHAQFSEALPQCPIQVVHKQVHVTFSLPERNRDQHVWASWRRVQRKFTAVLAALYRTSPPPRFYASG